MEFSPEDFPIRPYMDGPDIKWRYGKAPNYKVVDEKFLRERTRKHPPGSMERTVEDVVKTFEMEVSHKVDPKDIGSLDVNKFRMIINGTKSFTLQDILTDGSYNCFLAGSNLYDASKYNYAEQNNLFKKAMLEGFPWEILDIFSGPPVVSATWRHWSHFKGPYENTPPSGQLVELYGSMVATLNKDMKIEKVELFYDSTELLQSFKGLKTGNPGGKCPALQ